MKYDIKNIEHLDLKIHSFENKENLHYLFEGDNINSLLYLNSNQYTEKVDLIYIDPLYNAKNKYFKNYNDMKDNSDWGTFIGKRLILAKSLLKEEGLIFISIGEDEVCKLKLICDDIFGIQNKIAMFVIKTPNETESKNLIKNCDYLLVYGKSEKSHLYFPDKIQEARCTTAKENQSIHTITIPKGVRVVKVKDGVYDSLRAVGSNEDMSLENESIIVKNGRLEAPIRLKGRWSCPNDVNAWIKKFISGSNEPIYNKFGKEIKELYLKGDRFQPWLIKSGFEKPHTIIDQFISKGKNELKSIIGNNNFSYPKHSDFIKYIITIGTDKSDAIILDFFAGSGTTLQAVNELNKENSTDMSCILCTNNENNICYDITLPRILKSFELH